MLCLLLSVSILVSQDLTVCDILKIKVVLVTDKQYGQGQYFLRLHKKNDGVPQFLFIRKMCSSAVKFPNQINRDSFQTTIFCGKNSQHMIVQLNWDDPTAWHMLLSKHVIDVTYNQAWSLSLSRYMREYFLAPDI